MELGRTVRRGITCESAEPSQTTETELNAANFTAPKPKMLMQLSVHSLNRAIRFEIHVKNFFGMVRLGCMQILLRHL